MVGIEVDSSDFVKAESALSGVMSAEALAAVRGAAAWANPKPEMQYASPAAAEPAGYGAAEPAVALFLGDDEALTQSSGSERPLLTLVADKGEAHVTEEDARSDASELLSYILTLDEDIKKHLTGEIAALTSAVLSGKSSGVDVGAIRVLIDAAKATSDAGKAAESAEARRELLNEMHRLTEDIKRDVDSLRPLMDEEQRRRLDEAERAKQLAEEELARVRANPGKYTPEQIQAAENNVAQTSAAYGQTSAEIAGQVAPGSEVTRRIEITSDRLNNMSRKVQNGNGNDIKLLTSSVASQPTPRTAITTSAEFSDEEFGIETAEAVTTPSAAPSAAAGVQQSPPMMEVADIGNENSAQLGSPAANRATMRDNQTVTPT